LSLSKKLVFFIVAITLSACSDNSDMAESSVTKSNVVKKGITVSDAYIRGLPPGQAVTAAFMTVNNHQDKDCKLVGVTSPIASSAEIHEHRHKTGPDNKVTMSMRRVDSLVVPAGGNVSLQPGGYHLMMFGLENSLKEGEEHTITLSFEGCEELSIIAPVQSVLNEKAK
jgi:copper(I)-binding protein